ncbi:MAG: hypothetical protein OIF50_01565 [Flavobacteriaceae bacterium]|nr:hypothetical protein [Flavobacteriaceae bacterium]
MKNLISIFILLIIFTSCKTEPKTPQTQKPVAAQNNLSILDSIALAHGFANWKNITQLQYAFNVKRGKNTFTRHWQWAPKTQKIQCITATDTIQYTQTKNLDTLYTKTDKGFINDKFWLLLPFQLVWDQHSFTYTDNKAAKHPFTQAPCNQLTIVYKNEGGYTPGDAYDIFYNNKYEIIAWHFRKANAKEPSLTTTWEDYTQVQGLKLSQTRNNADGGFKLFFTDLQ